MRPRARPSRTWVSNTVKPIVIFGRNSPTARFTAAMTVDGGTEDRMTMPGQGRGLGCWAIGTNAIGGIGSRNAEYFVSLTTPMTSYTVEGKRGSATVRTVTPIGFADPRYRRANVSLTSATRRDVAVSPSSKSRPARSRIPSVLKYWGLTYVNFEDRLSGVLDAGSSMPCVQLLPFSGNWVVIAAAST